MLLIPSIFFENPLVLKYKQQVSPKITIILIRSDLFTKYYAVFTYHF